MLTQVGEGAAEAVELPDDEHVARPERAHATVESRSVVYAGREVLVDVDGVDARSAAGTATGSRPPSRRGPRRSACVVNGRLRQTGEGSVRPAPPCSTHTSPRTTRSWPPCWRRNEPDTAAYRAHAGLERPGPLGERRARGRRLHCFVLANDVDTEAFAFTTRPRTHFKRAAGRKGIPKVPRFAGPSHWPAGYSRWHSVRENTNRLHVVPHHTTLKPGFPFCLPRMAPYTPEGPPSARNSCRRTFVQLQRPSPQPALTCDRLAPLLSGHFSDTAPHVCRFFARRASLHSARASACRRR